MCRWAYVVSGQLRFRFGEWSLWGDALSWHLSSSLFQKTEEEDCFHVLSFVPLPLVLFPSCQLTKLPWLKHKIEEWCRENKIELQEEDNGMMEKIRG
jgi:hypothetical protein